jgi:hypothetical protein
MKHKSNKRFIIFIATCFVFVLAAIYVCFYYFDFRKIRLKTFPYTYKAALDINSDLDGTHTFEEFLEIQRFLNTKEGTSMGRGIGLEIGNSFWMYSGSSDDKFTYFKSLTTFPSGSAPIIRDFIKSGYIDVMHSYGNFSRVGGFHRDMALKRSMSLKSRGVWLMFGLIMEMSLILRMLDPIHLTS